MIDKYFPYIAGFSCSFAVLAYLFKLFRVYRKVQVNCWFCNQNTKVEYKYSNSFVCPFCEQYNGFTEDGDYNCIIREQHLNPLTFSSGQSVRNHFISKEDSKSGNGLCESCNLNQALKIRALAEFSSVSSDDNDEVDKFKERLEEIYGLCQSCQATLRQTLGKQNSWLKPLLISFRLMKSKEKSLNITSTKAVTSLYWRIFYYLMLFICLLLSVLSLEKYSPKSLQNYRKTFPYVNTAEISIVYSYLLWTGLALQSCLVFFFQGKIAKANNIISFIGWAFLLAVDNEKNIIGDKYIPPFKFSLNVLNIILLVWISRKMLSAVSPSAHMKRLKKKCVSVNSSYDGNSFISETRSCSEQNSPFVNPVDAFDEKEKVDSRKNVSPEEDLDADLLSLKISTPKKNSNSDFSPQNLFRGNSNSKNSVLQPSKFGKHFITQSSWVAGGYWGNPGSPQRGRLTRQNVSHLEEVKSPPVFSLSRSSSQTSGFVSQFSDCASSKSHSNKMQNLPQRESPSQQSSLTGDPVDRISLFSCGRNNSPTSFSSLRQQAVTDPYDAQSACSVSSYYSDTSRLRYRPSTRSGSCFHDNSQANLSADLSVVPYNNTTTSMSPGYFNLGVAFILGLSVSANLFLFILLWHNDVLVK